MQISQSARHVLLLLLAFIVPASTDNLFSDAHSAAVEASTTIKPSVGVPYTENVDRSKESDAETQEEEAERAAILDSRHGPSLPNRKPHDVPSSTYPSGNNDDENVIPSNTDDDENVIVVTPSDDDANDETTTTTTVEGGGTGLGYPYLIAIGAGALVALYGICLAAGKLREEEEEGDLDSDDDLNTSSYVEGMDIEAADATKESADGCVNEEENSVVSMAPTDSTIDMSTDASSSADGGGAAGLMASLGAVLSGSKVDNEEGEEDRLAEAEDSAMLFTEFKAL